MRYIKITLVFILLITVRLLSQNIPEEYSGAMTAYNLGDYNLSSHLFNAFIQPVSDKEVDNEFTIAAKFYLAESYIRLKQTDAAAAVLENFVSKYEWSGFHDESLYKLGLLYFDKNEYEKSRLHLEKLVDKYPSDEFTGSSLYFIGQSYTNEEKYDEAIEFFDNAIESKRNNKYLDYSIFSIAGIYETTGNCEKAVEYYDQLLAYHKSSPLAPNAQVRIGLCYFKLKNYDGAVLELTDPVIDDLPLKQKTEAKYILANSFYRLREYDNANEVYEKLIEDNPSSSLIRNIRYGLAWTFFQKGEYNEAFDLFTLLANDDSDSIGVSSYFWSAESKRYAGNESEANLIYEEFLEKYPDSRLIPQVQLQLGVTSYQKKKSNISEEFLLSSIESAAADDFTRGKAFILLGELKLNRKDFLKARNYFDKGNSIRDLPQELQQRAAFGLGITQFYLNQYDNSVQNLLEVQKKSDSFEKDKVNFYLGESFLAKKDFAQAVKHYNQVDLSNEELKLQTLYGKGYAYFNLKDFVNSSYNFNEYLKNGKKIANYVDAKLRLADSYYGEKKYSQASKIYKEVYLTDKAAGSNDYAYYQYAQALYKAGNSEEAILEFKNLQSRFPSSKYIEESQYIIGWIYFQKGNFSSAIKSFNELLTLYPNSSIIPIAYNSLGNSFFNIGKYDSAYIYYNKVLTDYPSTNYVFESINGIKDAFIATGNTSQAINLINDFIIKNPNASFADQLYFKKGEIYYSLHQYNEAKNSYKEFIDNYPNSQLLPEAYYWIGKSAVNLDQNEEALFNFNKVIVSYLDSEVGVASVLEMGKIHTNLKNYDAAVHIYQAAADKIPTSPKIPEILYNKALVLIEKGDIAPAYEDFNHIIQYYDGTIFAANSKFELGVLELARGNHETADVLFKELSENRIDDLGAKAQYYYGVSLMDQNKIDDAITAFVRVKFVFSGYDEWLTKSFLKLGECYEAKQDNQKAKEMYRTVLTRHKGDSLGLEAQNKLRALK